MSKKTPIATILLWWAKYYIRMSLLVVGRFWCNILPIGAKLWKWEFFLTNYVINVSFRTSADIFFDKTTKNWSKLDKFVLIRSLEAWGNGKIKHVLVIWVFRKLWTIFSEKMSIFLKITFSWPPDQWYIKTPQIHNLKYFLTFLVLYDSYYIYLTPKTVFRGIWKIVFDIWWFLSRWSIQVAAQKRCFWPIFVYILSFFYMMM